MAAVRGLIVKVIATVVLAGAGTGLATATEHAGVPGTALAYDSSMPTRAARPSGAVPAPSASGAIQRATDKEPQVLVQTPTLNVVGGVLELATPNLVVPLRPSIASEHEWVGLVPAVRVVDARGNLKGWQVRWMVHDVTVVGRRLSNAAWGGRVIVDPGDPSIVDGAPDGLHAGPARNGVRGGALFSADPGSGGGTYEAGGTLSLRLPSRVDAQSIVVELSFSLE